MNLGRTQFLSLTAKAVTTGLGIIQSLLVVWLLTRAEFGLVGLIMSIGGLIGVSQHLGIVDGTIREIAVLNDKRKIGKVFWVSHLTRQVVTIPLSLLLMGAADFIATYFYNRPEIVPYIRLFGIILILQGLQDVMGATVTGMKRFVALYTVQIVTALLNIAFFGLLTWRFGMSGFFWAIIITTAIMVLLLAYVIARHLRGNLALPHFTDIRTYGKQVMKIGAFMYVSRILFVIWQRLPILVLGGYLTSEQLGDLNISLAFGAKLTIIAAALSEVNLAWMSSLFANQQTQFRRVAQHNMQRIFVVMIGITALLLFFTPEIINSIRPEYSSALPLIFIITPAFFLYALLDIGTSTLFVAADRAKLRTFVFAIMTLVSAIPIALLFWFRPEPLASAVAVLAGSSVAYGVVLIIAARSFSVRFISPPLLRLLGLLIVSTVWLGFSPSFLVRFVVFVLLASYIAWEAYYHQLLPRPIGFLSSGDPRGKRRIICFAGAPYDQLTWTNRQHMMSRLSHSLPVLYIEPRRWIVRVLLKEWRQPRFLWRYLLRVVWFERRGERLFIKSQWNLLPGSREFSFISRFNHYLNLPLVWLTAHWLGFNRQSSCIWIYDTEAAEFLPSFKKYFVLYDCVDDHGAHVGAGRNPLRPEKEEAALTARANLITVTSRRLYELKKHLHPRVELVLNAGDVTLFSQTFSPEAIAANPLQSVPHPILGSVGALDTYKLNIDLIEQVARQHPDWHFVFIGSPVAEHKSQGLLRLKQHRNIHLLGAIRREQVPFYVHFFDVCLIPYIHSRYNDSSFPLKFWEFMATGKPIVAAGLPELKYYGSLIRYADTPEQFAAGIQYWLLHGKDKAHERRQLALTHSWEKRVERMVALLNQYWRQDV